MGFGKLYKTTFWWIKSNHTRNPHHPPPLMWTMFTVPIMAYIMKGGENMNGGLSKSFKKVGTLDFGGNPSPLVDLIHQNIFCITSLTVNYT